MALNQISVFLENREGTVSDVTGVFAANDINIRSICLAENSDFGIIRIIADDTYKAQTALKDAGYILKVTQVVGITIGDRAGSLHDALLALTDEGIDIRYMYSFLGGSKKDTAHIVIKVDNVKTAEAFLQKRGIDILLQEDT